MAPQPYTSYPPTTVHVRETTKRLSPFEKLPLEIRRKIYATLLNADDVRQPPDHDLNREYKFETAILRVNKQIYGEAYTALYYDNHFLVVSSNWDLIPTAARSHEVATIASTKPKLVAKFKEHNLRLHMDLPGGREKESKANKSKKRAIVSFILAANELPQFVRMICILKATVNVEMHKLVFRFEVNSAGPPTLDVQRLIMEPFRCLRLSHEELVLKGAIDPAHADNLRVNMVPEVNWVRGFAWEVYELMLSIARTGDEAFHIGLFDHACAKYTDCISSFEAAFQNDSRLPNLEDEGFHESCSQLAITALFNLTLATLRQEEWDQVIHGTNAWEEPVPFLGGIESYKSLIRHCRAIALAARQKNKQALKHLQEALKLDPQNQLLRDHISITSRRLAASTKSAKSATGTIYSADSLKQLNKPLEVPPPVLKPSEFIAGERYLLRHFGYQGDMLEGIGEKKPVDMKEMRKVIRNMETQKANVKPGKCYSAWVGADDRGVTGHLRAPPGQYMLAIDPHTRKVYSNSQTDGGTMQEVTIEGTLAALAAEMSR